MEHTCKHKVSLEFHKLGQFYTFVARRKFLVNFQIRSSYVLKLRFAYLGELFIRGFGKFPERIVNYRVIYEIMLFITRAETGNRFRSLSAFKIKHKSV